MYHRRIKPTKIDCKKYSLLLHGVDERGKIAFPFSLYREWTPGPISADRIQPGPSHDPYVCVRRACIEFSMCFWLVHNMLI